jgi:hypothetical protein
MKADNVFKFASIRPPRHARSLSLAMISSEIESKLKEELNWRINHGEPLEKARLDAAKDYIESESYFKNSERWKPFLQLKLELRSLLADLKSIDDINTAKTHIEAYFKRILPDFSVNEFSASPNFQKMKQEIWDSYYANVIIPDKRSFEREELVTWLIVFHILENWDSDDSFLITIQHADSLRPVVPKDLMQVPVVPKVDQPNDKKPKVDEARKKRIQNIRELIEALRRAKTIVSGIHETKLETATKESEEILHSFPAHQREKKGVKLPRVSANDPLQLEPKDFDEHKDVLSLLTQQEIDPFVRTVFDVLAKLENCIARKTVELGQLQIREHIDFRNGVFVKIRIGSKL